MIRARRSLAVLLALSAIAVPLACSDDDEASTTSTTSTVGEACPQGEPPDVDLSVPAEITDRGAPVVEPPAAPVTELEITDIVVGDGIAVEECDFIVAMYTGVGQISGQEFDSSWTTGEPIAFPLSGVIEGWSEGLLDMKVNGRRELVIPAALAYGDQGSPPVIAPGETLAFVIDLVRIYRHSSDGATTTTAPEG